MNNFGQNELKILIDSALSKREKHILISLEELQGNTFSTIVKILGKNYPESTIKFILRKLANKKLINCGNNTQRGLPLVLTNFGKLVIGVIVQPGRIAVSNAFGENSKSNDLKKTADGGSNPSDPTNKKGGEKNE